MTIELRVLVTGGRDWTDRNVLGEALWEATHSADSVYEEFHMTVVHGAAKGADELAGEWCKTTGKVLWLRVTEERHPADWDAHGKAAGPIRNSAMAKLGADLCLAFPTAQSIGTWDMVRKAHAAGIHARIYSQRKP